MTSSQTCRVSEAGSAADEILRVIADLESVPTVRDAERADVCKRLRRIAQNISANGGGGVTLPGSRQRETAVAEAGPINEVTSTPSPAAAPCDGDHGLPPCADSPCWQGEVPGLHHFVQALRDYQKDVVEDALEFGAECLAGGHTLRRRLYAAPTGTGKGTIELALLEALLWNGANAWILTPSLEVLRGFLERCGCTDLGDMGSEKLADLGEKINVTTPTRFRNRVCDGERGMPDVIIYDEVHHAIEGSEVSGTLFALAPQAVWFGFTATPYRGTPKATVALREAWGEPTLVLTIPEAVKGGYQALPTFEVVPLVDDDEIKVQAGQFHTKAATKAVGSRVAALAELVRDRLSRDEELNEVRPTIITVPSREIVEQLLAALDEHGISAKRITCDTPTKARAAAYVLCRTGDAVLITVRVLQEGFDSPWLKRIIDARPTLSAVSWVQQIGREMRPPTPTTPLRPEYLCVCRNLERHAYLLQGAVPREAIKDAQEAFEKPSKRAGMRSIGLESLSRYKAISLPLYGGATGTMYSLYSVDGETGTITEYAVLLDPCAQEPLCAARTVHRVEGQQHQYGKWASCALADDFTGFATSKFRGKLSKKMNDWWTRSAQRYGLDPAAADSLTRRQFAALPVLADTRRNLLVGA